MKIIDAPTISHNFTPNEEHHSHVHSISHIHHHPCPHSFTYVPHVCHHMHLDQNEEFLETDKENLPSQDTLNIHSTIQRAPTVSFQDAIDMSTIPNVEFYSDESSEAIQSNKLLLSSSIIRDSFKAWKKYVKESKENRNWIIQQWMLATTVWRRHALRNFMLRWHFYAMISANAKHFRSTVLKRKYLSKWVNASNLAREMNDRRIVKRALSGMMQQVAKTNRRLNSFQHSHLVKKPFVYWKDSARASLDERRRMGHFQVSAELQRSKWLKLHAFNAWHLKMSRRAATSHKLEVIQSRTSKNRLVKAFNKWLHPVRVNLASLRYPDVRHKTLRRSYFGIWVQKCRHRLSHASFVLKKTQNLVRYAFSLWKAKNIKAQRLSRSGSLLQMIVEQRLYRIYFTKWRNLYMKTRILQKTDSQFSVNRDETLLAVLFRKWIERKDASVTADRHIQTLQSGQNARILHQHFHIWGASYLHRKSAQIDRIKTLKKYWRLYTRKMHRVSLYLTNRATLISKRNNKRRLRSAFSYWQYHMLVIVQANRKAYSMSRYNLLRKSADTWITKVTSLKHKNESASQHYARSIIQAFFQRWNVRFHKQRKEWDQLLAMQEQLKINKAILEQFFKKWYDKIEKNRILAMRESAISRHAERKQKTQWFKRWVAFYLKNTKQIRLSNAQRRYKLQVNAFSHWKASYRHYLWQLKNISKMRCSLRKRLIHKCLMRWHSLIVKKNVLNRTFESQSQSRNQLMKRTFLARWKRSLVSHRLTQIEKVICFKSRSRTLRKCISIWKGRKMKQSALKFHYIRTRRKAFAAWRHIHLTSMQDRLSMELYYSKILRAAIRKWVFQYRLGIGTVDREGGTASLLIKNGPRSTISLVKRTIKIPVHSFASMTPLLRLLHTTKVALTMNTMPGKRSPSRLSASGTSRANSCPGSLSSSPIRASTISSSDRISVAQVFLQWQNSVNLKKKVAADMYLTKQRKILYEAFTRWRFFGISKWRFAVYEDAFRRHLNVRRMMNAFISWRNSASVFTGLNKAVSAKLSRIRKNTLMEVFSAWTGKCKSVWQIEEDASRIRTLFVVVKYFKKWIHETTEWRSITLAVVHNRDRKTKQRVMRIMQDKFITQRHSKYEAGLDRIARQWYKSKRSKVVFRRVVDRFKRICGRGDLAASYDTHRIMRMYLLKWIRCMIVRVSNKKAFLVAIRYHKEKVEKNVFQYWSSRTKLETNLKMYFKSWHGALTVKVFKWWRIRFDARRRMHRKFMNLKNAVELLIRAKLNRTFHIWLHRMQLNKEVRHFQARRRHNEIWPKMHEPLSLTKQRPDRTRDMYSVVFKIWYLSAIQSKVQKWKVIAQTRVLFNIWRKKSTDHKKHSTVVTNNYVAPDTDKENQHPLNAEEETRDSDDSSVMQIEQATRLYIHTIFNKWVGLYKKNKLRIPSAVEFEAKNLKYKTLSKWHHRLESTRVDVASLDAVLKKKKENVYKRVFGVWKKAYQLRKFETIRKQVSRSVNSRSFLKRILCD